nr:unnamed protein product [Spirometra erinaceieuropaei]
MRGCTWRGWELIVITPNPNPNSIVSTRYSQEQPAGTENSASRLGTGAIQVGRCCISETRFSEQDQLEEASTRLSTSTINDLLFADGSTLNNVTEVDIERSMDLLASGCAHFGLAINTDNTVVRHQQPSDAEYGVPRIRVNATKLEFVDNFNNLDIKMSHCNAIFRWVDSSQA